jgi:hypothetical protein
LQLHEHTIRYEFVVVVCLLLCDGLFDCYKHGVVNVYE